MDKQRNAGKGNTKSEKSPVKKRQPEKPIAPRPAKMGFHGEDNEKNLNPEE